MKEIPLIVICALLTIGCANHQPNHTSTATPSPSPSVAASGPDAAVATRSYPGVGTVKAIDLKAPAIEIDHGDIEGLMPAMQMEFQVSDAALLNGIAVNDRIDFTIEDRIGVMRVIDIKKK